MPKELVKCKKCQKEFYVFPCKLREKRGKFCSKKCSSSVLGKRWKIAEHKRQNMVRNCWKGKDNPAWIDGRSRERGYNWFFWKETLRESIRQRDNYTCRVCNKLQKDEALSIHHIDYDKDNYNPNNLISLCRGCHTKTNFSRDYWSDNLSKIRNT